MGKVAVFTDIMTLNQRLPLILIGEIIRYKQYLGKATVSLDYWLRYGVKKRKDVTKS